MAMTLTDALNLKIRTLLAERGWSQRDFAKVLGVSQGSVSYLTRGLRRGDALDFYQRLAGIFGQPLSALFAELEAIAYLDEQAGQGVAQPSSALSNEFSPPGVDVSTPAAAAAADHGGVPHVVVDPTVFLAHAADLPPAQHTELLDQFTAFLHQTYTYFRAVEEARNQLVHGLPPPATAEPPAAPSAHHRQGAVPGRRARRRRRRPRKHRHAS